MADQDGGVGPEWLAYDALQGEEPVEFALEYLTTAFERVAFVIWRLRSEVAFSNLPLDVEKELSGLQLFLLALGNSANAEIPTPIVLKLDPRRGRPKNTRARAQASRDAAQQLLERQRDLGPRAAATEAAERFGIPLSEAGIWATHLEAETKRFAAFRAMLARARHVEGRFERGDQRARAMYLAAISALDRVDQGADLTEEAIAFGNTYQLDAAEAERWIRDVARARCRAR